MSRQIVKLSTPEGQEPPLQSEADRAATHDTLRRELGKRTLALEAHEPLVQLLDEDVLGGRDIEEADHPVATGAKLDVLARQCLAGIVEQRTRVRRAILPPWLSWIGTVGARMSRDCNSEGITGKPPGGSMPGYSGNDAFTTSPFPNAFPRPDFGHGHGHGHGHEDVTRT